MRAFPGAALFIIAGLAFAGCGGAGGGAGGSGSGNGSGNGNGSANGSRDGNGSGNGSGVGDGNANGSGSANGSVASGDEVAPACPGSFADAQRANGCAEGPPECSYPEGSCYCGEPRRCSGAAWEPMPPSMHSWQCTATPPDVRPDGCPGVAPSTGSARDAGQRCAYGDCGGAIYGCLDGRWQVVEIMAPPP